MSDILTIVGMTAIMFFGSEMFDCSLPYYDGESITKGKICQWEKEDFEYVKSIPYTHCEWEDKEEVCEERYNQIWKLKTEENPDDNFFERKTRERYARKDN